MLARIKDFVKAHLDDIILLIGVILISLFSFAMGYITAKQQKKEPIKIELIKQNYQFSIYEGCYYRRGDLRIISCLEAG